MVADCVVAMLNVRMFVHISTAPPIKCLMRSIGVDIGQIQSVELESEKASVIIYISSCVACSETDFISVYSLCCPLLVACVCLLLLLWLSLSYEMQCRDIVCS